MIRPTPSAACHVCRAPDCRRGDGKAGQLLIRGSRPAARLVRLFGPSLFVLASEKR